MESKISDRELIRGCMDGDNSSTEELIRRHKDRVYGYISMYIRDQALAEDIFQETFLKVINCLNAGRYREDGKFLSWVMRIAHNLIIDHFRRSKQMGLVSNDDYETDIFNSRKFSDPNIEESLVKKQVVSDVRRLIRMLPPDQREVVIMRHYTGLSFKEIADITGVSINTALGRMRYALINMRKLMEEHKINLKTA